ncbi:SH3 domain-containing protein [Streptomyces sp. NPDC001315]|uniref:SH3 domain-containing protein n=1 Tax=Streptomyces sp. NPDC001315 TaxID=3364562 RepID=UPI00369ACD5A
MSARSALARLAIATAAGALVATAAVTPAAAHDVREGGDPRSGQPRNAFGQRGDDPGPAGQDQQSDQGDPRWYTGVVTARGGLLLRSRPDRGSQVIRRARQGEIVSIFCKTAGDNVRGNPLWYLLTDGTWAWGPARYIDNIGPAPRWC